MASDHGVPNRPTWDQGTRLSDELVLLLRHRIAGGYYNQPQVIDALARALIRAHVA